VTAAISAVGLGKRFGRKWALKDCTVEIPSGRICGLVGPNGAGKSTLLNLAVGLLSPTEGQIQVAGGSPGSGAGQLAKIGFLAQQTPVYESLSIADHLRFGEAINPRWDRELARERLDALELDPKQQAGSLSGGQRAQLALTLAMAKRPEVLLLDEPVASLDPLARRDFLRTLTAYVAEHDVSVVLSSHLLADLERVCDYLVVLVESRVQLSADVDELLATHRRLIGPRRAPDTLPADQTVIEASHTDRQSTLLVRTSSSIHDPTWQVEDVGLEDIVLAYMGGTADVAAASRPTLEVAQ
jgi:ABC-2 type transport system ATP-binding protein